MLSFLQELKLFFLDSLFPYVCVFCYKEGEVICRRCSSKLVPLESQFCIGCGKNSFSGLTHENCSSKWRADGLISMYPYDDVSKLIIEGKYNFIARIFEVFGIHLADFLLSLGLKNNFKHFVITALPLSNSRLRWRGFNQSYLTANALASRLGLRYKELLVRGKHKKSQKDLNREERLQNVKDAFELFPCTNVKDKNILLVDDVITTGATLSEAVKVLKQAGCNEVWCLTVARD